MGLIYSTKMPREVGRPPVATDPEHMRQRAEARGLRRAGKTQSEVAEEMGVAVSTIRRWEKMDAAITPARAS